MSACLNLIVLWTGTVRETLSFYEALGLEFVGEQHGNGPIHHACTLGKTVIEIYPGTNNAALDPYNAGATMLGFQVDDLDRVLTELQEIGATVLLPPKFGIWGRRSVAQDPDGRRIQLVEQRREAPALL